MTLEPIFLVAALLALAPFVLVLLTCFTKIAVVLSLLRYALGVPQIPSDRIITTVALALTFFVMAPTAAAVWTHIDPWVQQHAEGAQPAEIAEVAVDALEPMLAFAAQNADPSEIGRMVDLAHEVRGHDLATPTDPSVVLPAFLITELNEAFLIGALLFVPFVALDLFVANLLISLGLVAVRTTTVSLPLKLALFVLADGWYLLIRGLALGYA